MRRKLRQRRSPIMLAAIFLAGALAEGGRLNELHTRVAIALEGEAPLQAVRFVSAAPADDVTAARAKCAHRGET